MGQPFPGELLLEVSESKIAKLFVYFFVCGGHCYNIFLTGDCVALFVFLGNGWVWEKIPLEFVKLWEMKNQPWDCEKGNDAVGHTLKLWELKGLKLQKFHPKIILENS